MTTSYIKKIPIVMGLLFFSVASLAAIVSGVSLALALLRGALAAVIAFVFAWPVSYLLFDKEIPKVELPPELLHHRPEKPDEE